MMSNKISNHEWMPMTADLKDLGLIYSAYHETRSLVIGKRCSQNCNLINLIFFIENYILSLKLQPKILQSIIRVIW